MLIAELSPQIDAFDFFVKAVGTLVPIFGFALYLLVRRLFSGSNPFVNTGQSDERELAEAGKVTLAELQTTAWEFNARMVVQYFSFASGTVVLAAIFIFEQRLQGYDAWAFHTVLFIVAFAVLAYILSLQLWCMALDCGGSLTVRLGYRNRATTFQVIGWFLLCLAVVLSVLIVNTLLGYLVSIIALFIAIYLIESKAAISKNERARNAGPNTFQRSLDVKMVYYKNPEEGSILPSGRSNIRILSWNIERGYNPERLAEYINRIRPDVALLQEVDWGCERTGQVDVLDYLARETHMLGVFGIEFLEICTPYRNTKLKGGGVHGNALLTKWKPSQTFRVELPACFDWSNPPSWSWRMARREKRIGARFGLGAEFSVAGTNLVVCSIHLEDKFGGVAGRYTQYIRVVDEIRQRFGDKEVVVIAGDFNTFDNRRARALYTQDTDSNALGKPDAVDECDWWKKELLPEAGYVDPFDSSCWTFRYTPFFKKKLDWITVRNAKVSCHGVGPFSSSDHRPLWVDLSLTRNVETGKD